MDGLFFMAPARACDAVLNAPEPVPVASPRLVEPRVLVAVAVAATVEPRLLRAAVAGAAAEQSTC